jgi:putative endonuclease
MTHASSNAWCVYILSNNAHTLYVGSTNDLLRRLPEHKQKIYEKAFTARYTFDRCVYYEHVDSEQAARAREKQIKGWTRAKKIALIQKGIRTGSISHRAFLNCCA